MLLRSLRWCLVLVVLSGCGDGVSGGDGGLDGGSRTDAGRGDAGTRDDAGPTEDAGPGEDAGARMDGGAEDAASGDAGAACASDEGCASTEYCAKETCEAPSGVCAAIPTACPDVAAPVCGCDGVTYGNSCEAAAASQNVASDGACPSPDAGVDAGPGGCTSNADCLLTDYCRLPVGACGGTGTCTMRPFACPDVYDPVCGCDGTTYSNSCDASASGVNVASRGECGGTGCGMTPAPGCCFDDADCRSSGVGRAQRCEGATCASGGEGVCVATSIASGRCWNDGDCAPGESCTGARICPCGAACLLPDEPGTCS